MLSISQRADPGAVIGLIQLCAGEFFGYQGYQIVRARKLCTPKVLLRKARITKRKAWPGKGAGRVLPRYAVADRPSNVITIYIGGVEVMKGNITAGNIAEFIVYLNMLSFPVISLGWVTSLIQRAAASQKRINEFLQEQPEIISPKACTYIC
jgi:hypothetical protein